MQTSTLARRAGAARDVSANVFKKKAKVAPKAKVAAPKRSSSQGEDGLWLPNTERPEWLDGSLPGDRGFDPLGLSKPTEYIQVSRNICFLFCLRPLWVLLFSEGGLECGREREGWKTKTVFFREKKNLTARPPLSKQNKKQKLKNRSALTSSTRTRP